MKTNLSAQEKRVATLAAAGKIDKEIAREMGISLGTVRVYWKRLRTKLGGLSRTEAMLKAVGRGEVVSDHVATASADTFELIQALAEAAFVVANTEERLGFTWAERLGNLNEAAHRCADRLESLGYKVDRSEDSGDDDGDVADAEFVDDPDEPDDSEMADGMHRRAA